MSDEKPTPDGDAPPQDDAKAAAKAAAKAEAAEKAAAKTKDDTPKQPWEEKPRPPTAEDAADDPDVVALDEAIEGLVLSAQRFAGDVTVSVPREHIVDICRFLKERGYTFLVDLTAVDWPERAGNRFDVVYWLHRFDDSKRLRLLAGVPEGEPIASVTGVWRTADWLEREVYDMFGVTFDGHPNLERILMWEGFNGYPLRKDFPVEGIDTGAAIYPDTYPEGYGPVTEEEGAK
jgi:NADH-quinone oxidoreductase subunit C